MQADRIDRREPEACPGRVLLQGEGGCFSVSATRLSGSVWGSGRKRRRPSGPKAVAGFSRRAFIFHEHTLQKRKPVREQDRREGSSRTSRWAESVRACAESSRRWP